MDSANPRTAAGRLKKVSSLRPTFAVVLGSGFHHVLAELRVDKKIAYSKIPGFPKPTVSGHAGELYFGHLGLTPVLVLSGRAHFYEGHPMERVTFAVRTLAAAGICKEKLSHTEVLETAERVKKFGAALIRNFAELYGKI